MAKKVSIQFLGDPIANQVKAHYEKMMIKYASKWDTDIVFTLCHGDHSKVPKEMDFDKFYIFIQLLPKDFEGVIRTSIKELSLDGLKIKFPKKEGTTKDTPQGDSLSFSKAPAEARIICDDKGLPMAAVYDSALWIMNDFIHCRTPKELENSVKTFEYLIDQAVRKTDFLEHLKAGIEEKSKRALNNAVQKGFKQRLEKEKLQLQAAKDTVSQYLKSIVTCERKAITAERMITVLKNNLSDIPASINKTWLSLKKMEGSALYSNISFMKTGIKATTNPIFIDFEKTTYEMGKFEITLGFNGETVMKNISNKINSYDHPHVNNGVPCWGNMVGTLPKLIGYSEFDVALVMIHTFLSSYDSASPYHAITYWPKKKQPKTEVKK